MLKKLLLSVVFLSNVLIAHADLALVAEVHDEVYSKFEARGGKIWGISNQGFAKPLPNTGVWSLRGDMLTNADFARFSPDYEIAKAVVPTGEYAKETNMIGTVFLDRNDDWHRSNLDNAIAVLAWMKDGEPTWIEVEAARVTNGPSWSHAAMFVRELAEEERKGYPVMFLLKNGEFIAAKSEFTDRSLNHAVAVAHLGSKSEFSDALQQVQSPNVRSPQIQLSLLGIVAKTGRLEMVEELLKNGTEIDSSASKHYSALAAAALKGRVNVVQHLLLKATDKEAKRMCTNLIPFLADKMQIETALVLIEAGFRKDANKVLQVALSLREAEIAKKLLALEIRSPLFGIERDSLVAAASTGDADLLRSLINAGMKGSSRSNTSTALIAAVQSGNAEAVEVLLKAKAKTEAKDAHGFRAIDYTSVLGDKSMKALLKDFGAKPTSGQDLPEQPRFIGRVHSEAEVDQLPVLVDQDESSNSRVAIGNALITDTTLGRSIRFPKLYFAKVGPDPITRKATPGEDRSYAGLGYARPSLYGALSIVVDSKGNIAEIDVIPYMGNSRRLLEFNRLDDDKQIAAVMAHQFEPGKINGVPVPTRVTVPLLVQNYLAGSFN